jgi:hypothetical protein
MAAGGLSCLCRACAVAARECVGRQCSALQDPRLVGYAEPLLLCYVSPQRLRIKGSWAGLLWQKDAKLLDAVAEKALKSALVRRARICA